MHSATSTRNPILSQHPLKELLTTFNLTPAQQAVYLALAESSWSSVLHLSKKTELKRTSIYRLLDELIGLGLVKMHASANTSLFAITGAQAFDALATRQQLKAAQLRHTLESFMPQLQLLETAKDTQLEIKQHRGTQAMQALEWHLAQTPDSETLVLGTDQWVNYLGKEFADSVRDERERHRILVRELLNPTQYQPIVSAESASWTDRSEYIQKCYRHRRLPTRLLHITTEHIILPATNQVVIYSFEAAQPMAIELTSHNLTVMWAQLFELLWSHSKARDDFG